MRPQQRPVRPVVAGIPLSHPDRVVFPDVGVSKLDLARYYEAIARWIVPHVKARPLTLVHCPDGVGGPCRYLRHAKAWGPTALRRVKIQEKTKVGDYLVADSAAAVVALAQMGVVEIHTWNSTTDDIERPNRIVWDLDPGPAITWQAIAEAARLLRQVLDTLGLASWVKTTGGQGLHVVVPLKPRHDWSHCLRFSRAVSEVMVRANPGLYTTAFSKRGREEKILLDYLRNNRTNTSICAYSPRARRPAPVSVPIRWDDLRHPPQRWTLVTIRERLGRLRTDPWAGYWTSPQLLSERALRAVENL